MICECPIRLNVIIQGGEMYLGVEREKEEECEEDTQ